ncbi:PIN domain-containing protein [Chytriomyces cf. hyalinus JEL632]|nr:PIN domain-containing protein [Chytriomyces cf. hyalinus JEL632]
MPGFGHFSTAASTNANDESDPMDIDDENFINSLAAEIANLRAIPSSSPVSEPSGNGIPSIQQLPSKSTHAEPESSTKNLKRAVIVIDTNAWISHSNFCKRIMLLLPSDTPIAIPRVVIRELDGLKGSRIMRDSPQHDVKILARFSGDLIYRAFLEKKANVIGQKSGETLYTKDRLPEGRITNDDWILDYARYLKKNLSPNVFLVSNDKNLCTKAIIESIQTVSNFTGSAESFCTMVGANAQTTKANPSNRKFSMNAPIQRHLRDQAPPTHKFDHLSKYTFHSRTSSANVPVYRGTDSANSSRNTSAYSVPLRKPSNDNYPRKDALPYNNERTFKGRNVDERGQKNLTREVPPYRSDVHHEKQHRPIVSKKRTIDERGDVDMEQTTSKEGAGLSAMVTDSMTDVLPTGMNAPDAKRAAHAFSDVASDIMNKILVMFIPSLKQSLEKLLKANGISLSENLHIPLGIPYHQNHHNARTSSAITSYLAQAHKLLPTVPNHMELNLISILERYMTSVFQPNGCFTRPGFTSTRLPAMKRVLADSLRQRGRGKLSIATRGEVMQFLHGAEELWHVCVVAGFDGDFVRVMNLVEGWRRMLRSE